MTQGQVVRDVDQVPSIKVTEPSRNEAADAGRRSRDDGSSLADQFLIYAALLVVVGAFLAIAFAVQVFYLGLSLRAMRDSAQRAERNVIAGQRAFVSLGELVWVAAGENIEIGPVWLNTGATPTRRLKISTNWKATHVELRPEYDINYVQAPENLFLGPATRAKFGTIFVPMRDIQAAIEDRLKIYVWGRATYEDIFEGTRPHFFEFCHRLDVAGETPGKIELRFSQVGMTNRSDEDSQAPQESSASLV